VEYLIVGLGNPGEQYDNTRHNAGFMLLDALVHHHREQSPSWRQDKKNQAITTNLTIADRRVLLVKPQTFMNRSGFAVGALAGYYQIPVDKILVAHDDLDLPIGHLRLKLGGGSGGHRGINSIAAQLGSTEFVRIRLGIGDPHWFDEQGRRTIHGDASGYVLGVPGSGQQALLDTALKEAAAAVEVILDQGIEVAMNQHNRALSTIKPDPDDTL